MERLERELTELASHIHAATCRWLGLVAEFDRVGGWAAWGCKSCAHFISWRCSIAPVAAREHVRVAHRLESLPLIRAAFAEGRLSYSKVRALTRVQGVQHEAELLSMARHATAAQLERAVRAYRGVARAARVAEGGRPVRSVRWHHADDGSLVLEARLPAEEGALVLAALEAGVDRLFAAGASAEPPGRSSGPALPGVVPGESASAEAPGRPVGPVLSGALLGDDASAEAAGQSVGPVLSGALSGDGASAEAPVTLAERRADALLLMADALLGGAEPAGARGDRFQVVVHVDAATLQTGGTAGRSELAGDGGPIAPHTARRLACDAALVPLLERDGRPLRLGRKTRAVSSPLRRALTGRDGGCRFPGCTTRRHVDAHHIEHWANGGRTELENLVQLCRHHHRLLHEGGYSVQKTGRAFVFRRPDGRTIPDAPRPRRGDCAGLRAAAAVDRTVVPDACVPLSGDGMDLGLAVDALLFFAPLEEAIGV